VDDVSTMGKKIPVKIQLRYPGRVPIGRVVLEIEYYNVVFRLFRQQQIVLEPGKGKTIEYELPFVSENCGKTNLKVTKVYSYDLMGIWKKALPLPEEIDILIYPELKIITTTRKSLHSAKNAGDQYDVAKKGQDVSEVFDIREYKPGDSVKSIHWKLSGKMDKMIVREFGHPTNFQTAIYYDLYIGEKKNAETVRKFQNAILQMTASLSKSILKKGYSHHMISFEENKTHRTLIEDNVSYLTNLAEMMCRQLPGNSAEHEMEQQLLMQEKDFTKIIFLCGELNEDYIKDMAQYSSITVIYLVEEGEEYVSSESNYDIITIPIESMKHKIRTLEL
jgi:uncharacterized protein (DUF58 family)